MHSSTVPKSDRKTGQLLMKMLTCKVHGVITNDVNNYINLLVRIAHIICNHPICLQQKLLKHCMKNILEPLFELHVCTEGQCIRKHCKIFSNSV